jgi:hypothetical protein
VLEQGCVVVFQTVDAEGDRVIVDAGAQVDCCQYVEGFAEEQGTDDVIVVEIVVVFTLAEGTEVTVVVDGLQYDWAGVLHDWVTVTVGVDQYPDGEDAQELVLIEITVVVVGLQYDGAADSVTVTVFAEAVEVTVVVETEQEEVVVIHLVCHCVSVEVDV